MNPLAFDSEKLLDVIAKRQQAEMQAKRRVQAGNATTSTSTSTAAAVAAEKQAARIALDKDLSEVLYGRVPREYGQLPEHTGAFVRICPSTPAFERIMKVKNAHLRPRAARPPLA